MPDTGFRILGVRLEQTAHLFRAPLLKKRWLKRSLLLTALSALLLWGLDWYYPLPEVPGYSPLVYARDSTLINGFLSGDDKWRMHTALEEISPLLRETILQKEDKYFYYHFGVNPVAVFRAAFQNLRHERRVSGASTITMQVARLLEPKARTYPNKFLEMLRAFQLEWHYSKDEILQLYLNLVPYGGNVEGVKSAAWLYFRQRPEQLSLAQVVTLSIIPNRPSTWGFDRNPAALLKARNRWLERFRQAGVFPDKEIATALREPLAATYQPVPNRAPHLAQRLHQNHPHRIRIQTTLDAEMQAQTARLTQDFARRIQRLGIHNAAVIVVENQTRKVRAYVGSPDFQDDQHGGQVDGVQAIRSPGSTLKPLLYGLAIDEGLLTPKTQLVDLAVDFDGYAPENFNGKFNGKVSVEEALAYSLNVPAVRVLHRLGVHQMTGALRKMQFRQVQQDYEKLGLSLALGGCGVSLEELVRFYAGLAQRGNWQPLRWGNVQEQDTTRAFQVLSPEAGFMLREILLQVERPDLPADYQNSRHVPQIAWKTGTSYGRHDAWSIGFSQRYTIGVWVGNFSGAPSPYLTGAQVATPLLFKLFLSLDYDAPTDSPKPPSSLQTRLVCAETGHVPSAFCQNRVADYFIPKVSPAAACEHLRYHWISDDATVSYCAACLPPDGSYKKALYPNLPPELIAYYHEKNIRYKQLPPHATHCPRIRQDTDAPRITSPTHGRTYLREGDTPVVLQLACQTANDAQFVYWYLNGAFFKKARADEELFVEVKPGDLRISCSDERGRNTDIRVRVE